MTVLGACALVIRGEPTGSDSTLATLRNDLAPVIACLCRELAQVHRHGQADPHDEVSTSFRETDNLAESRNELEWLLSIGSALPSGEGFDEPLARLLAASVTHLGCELGAIRVPDKQLSVVQDRNADARDALRQLDGPLLRWAIRLNRPIVVNYVRPTQSLRAAFKILALPVCNLSNRPCGVLIFLRSGEAPDFSSMQMNTGHHLVRDVAALLDTQFDHATGLYTRAALQSHVQRWSRDVVADRVHCVIHVDIDRLHVINDTRGFKAGDELIVRVAQLLASARLPKGALTARIAGDAFAAVLPHTTDEEAIREAQRLQQGASDLAHDLLDSEAPVSLSCGIASFADPTTDFEHALTLAQVACKAAKDHGRGRIEIYHDNDSSMRRRYDDTATLGRLRQVLREDRLTLYAQRIMPLQRLSEYGGYELLLRALDDGAHNSAPAALFSAAQRYQMESAIDLWVLEHAITQAARYRAELLAAQVSLSINICGTSLVDEVLAERLKGWIRDSHLAPALLTFEITESVAVSDCARALEFIREMRALGCRFALDDVGTGVNSLKNLKRLPVDRVKIDGSFVSDLLSNEQSVATVRAIVTLARELGIETVAEYAETPAIVVRLRELGVDYAQGYAVDKPQPFADVLETLRAQHIAEGYGLQCDV